MQFHHNSTEAKENIHFQLSKISSHFPKPSMTTKVQCLFMHFSTWQFLRESIEQKEKAIETEPSNDKVYCLKTLLFNMKLAIFYVCAILRFLCQTI